MVVVKVKWGKELLRMEVDPSLGFELFGAQLQSLTNVPPQKQKVTVPGKGMLKSDEDMDNLRDGMTVMLIGTAELAPASGPSATPSGESTAPVSLGVNPPKQPVASAEAEKGKSKSNLWELESNGLRNIGNTCYLNATLQALRHVPELRIALRPAQTDVNRAIVDLFAGAGPTAAAGPRLTPVEKQLGGLMTKLDSDLRSEVVPVAFYAAFTASYPTFARTDDRGYPMQQDAQEALSMILSEITRRVAQTPASSPLATKLPNVKQMLSGELIAKTLTTTAEAGSQAEAATEILPFTILPCNIDDEVITLEAGLEKAMTESTVGRDRQLRFHALPEYLFVHILRFTWRKDTKKKAKVLKPITFPVTCLDVYSLCSPELQQKLNPEREKVKKLRDEVVDRRRKAREKTSFDDDEKEAKKPEEEKQKGPFELGNTHGYYELFSVISHRGRDADGGHYVAWVKKKSNPEKRENIWVVYDDEHVATVSEEDIFRLRGVGEAHIAYILVYRSRHPLTGDPPLPL